MRRSAREPGLRLPLRRCRTRTRSSRDRQEHEPLDTVASEQAREMSAPLVSAVLACTEVIWIRNVP
ncbi:hypothetical protein M446_4262 [Methylobacterium sp. 4-46]|nr:hypothetical protein M446_4262 [Methylobacterium sp. 4-46]